MRGPHGDPTRGNTIFALVTMGLFLWALVLACQPSARPDHECVKAKFVAACTQACSNLGGPVVISTPYSRSGWADCTCAASMEGSSAGWDDHRSFKIWGSNTVPGFEWAWHECWKDSRP